MKIRDGLYFNGPLESRSTLDTVNRITREEEKKRKTKRFYISYPHSMSLKQHLQIGCAQQHQHRLWLRHTRMIKLRVKRTRDRERARALCEWIHFTLSKPCSIFPCHSYCPGSSSSSIYNIWISNSLGKSIFQRNLFHQTFIFTFNILFVIVGALPVGIMCKWKWNECNCHVVKHTISMIKYIVYASTILKLTRKLNSWREKNWLKQTE